MSTTKRRSPRTVALYFALALIFASLAILASRLPSLQWVFWLLTALSVFCLAPLFDAFLYQLHLRKSLPRFIDGLFDDGIATKTNSVFMRMGLHARSLGGRITVGGLAVFASIFLLSKTGAFKEMQVDSYLYENVSRSIGKKESAATKGIAASLVLDQPERDETEYLQDCLTIVKDLKNIGAKAVLVDFRRKGKPGNIDLLKKIEQTGIAVFGLSQWTNFRFAEASGEIVFSKASITMQPYEVQQDPFLLRIRPEGIRQFSGDLPMDATLELLRKYHNYPIDLEVTRRRAEAIFGDYRIPVGSDGWMYVRQSQIPWVERPPAFAYRTRNNDSVEYRRLLGYLFTREDLKDTYGGKIVFLERAERSAPQYTYFVAASYVCALQAITEGRVISRSETLHVWLTLVCILLAGLTAFKLRPLPSMLTIFALGFVTLLACWLLYDRFYILVDVIYPLLAVGMSMFVFPAITVAQKMEEDEEAS